ncbi:MAG: hypothetical protein IK057_00950 [Clostridia bacterium]|nr:hypothetical protein [Clostridia bacterium]
MYRRYYSYSDMPQMVVHNGEKPKKQEQKTADCKPQCSPECNNNKVLGRFELDDIILGIVIIALLLDDGDDSVLLLALAIIFLTGIN